MSASETKFTGRWLHHGEWYGKEFSHELAEYHHDEHPGSDGATAMRHAWVQHKGKILQYGYLPHGLMSKPARRLRAIGKLWIAGTVELNRISSEINLCSAGEPTA